MVIFYGFQDISSIIILSVLEIILKKNIHGGTHIENFKGVLIAGHFLLSLDNQIENKPGTEQNSKRQSHLPNVIF